MDDRVNSNPKVVDALIHWKSKTVFRPDTSQPASEGYFPHPIEDGITDVSEDAVWYMQRLLEKTGIDLSEVPDWQDGLCIARWDTPLMGTRSISAKDGRDIRIPKGTLYLRINVNRRDGDGMDLHLVPAPKAEWSMQRDKEAEECGRRLVSEERIFRVWLDINVKHYDKPRKKPKYASPMSKLMAKPRSVSTAEYRMQLSEIDIVAH